MWFLSDIRLSLSAGNHGEIRRFLRFHFLELNHQQMLRSIACKSSLLGLVMRIDDRT